MIIVEYENLNYFVIFIIIAIVVVVLYYSIQYLIQKVKRDNEKTLAEITALKDMRDDLESESIEIPLPKKQKRNRKYLDDLNEGISGGISPDDKRHAEWAEDRAIYGFDERDTWNLDTTMIELLYERVMYFVEFAPIDLERHQIMINDEEKLLSEWLDELTNVCESYLDVETTNIDEQEANQYRIWTIWRGVSGYMWW